VLILSGPTVRAGPAEETASRTSESERVGEQGSHLLFHDDFESYPTGSPPSGQVQGGGSWYDTDCRVEKYARRLGPMGAKTLEIAQNPGRYRAFAQAARPISAGERVHVEFQLFWSGPSGRPWLGLMTRRSIDPQADAAVFLWLRHQDNEILAYDGAMSHETGLKAVVDDWAKYEIDYVVGSGLYTLTVGGRSRTLRVFMKGNAARPVTGLFFTAHPKGGGANYFLDGVRMSVRSPSGVGEAPQVGPESVCLENDRTLIEFSRDRSGISLTRLNCIQPPRRFLSSAARGAPLWRLALREPSYDPKTQVLLDSTVPAGTAVVERRDGDVSVVQMEWRNLDLPGEPHALDVTVTVALPPGQAMSRWTVAVRNRSAKRGLWYVEFPVLPNLFVGRRGRLATPLGWGDLTENPVAAADYTAASYGAPEAKDDLATNYPFYLCTMQFTCLSNHGVTLYVTPHDPEGYVKQINWRGVRREHRLEYWLRQYPEGMGSPGRDYQSPYPTAVGFLEGDWFDAAKRYRRWVIENTDWVPQAPMERYDGYPEWIKTNAVSMWGMGSGKEEWDELRRVADIKRKFDDVGLLHQMYWWAADFVPNQKHDQGFPDIFFNLRGGQDQLDLMRKHHAAGVRLVPYTNPNLVDAATEYWRKGGWRWAALPAEQAHRRDEWIAEIDARVARGESVNVPMCPYAKERQDIVVEWCKKIVGEFGADGVYLDQIGGLAPVLCFDPTHGHPLGGGKYFVQGYRRMAKRCRDAIRAVNPEAILTTEAAAEPYGPLFDAYLRCNETHPWVAPIWPAVYGGFYISLGTYLNSAEDLGGVPYAAMFALHFTLGAQMGQIRPRFKVDPTPPWLKYLHELARARTKAARWIAMGEFLRPPRLTEVDQVVGNWKYREQTQLHPAQGLSEQEVSWPAVLTAAFRAADGTVALVFTNYTDKERTCRWAVRAADLGFPEHATCEVSVLYPESAAGPRRLSGPQLSGRLELDPLSCLVLKVARLGEGD